MLNTKTISSGIVLLLGVVLLAAIVSFLSFLFYGRQKEPTTIIVERPVYRYGGLPGYGFHPRPYPKPSAPPAQPPAPPAQPPAPPAQPPAPPANP